MDFSAAVLELWSPSAELAPCKDMPTPTNFLSLSPHSIPGTGEGMGIALAWMPSPLTPCPMPSSVSDLTPQMLQTKLTLTKHSAKSVYVTVDLTTAITP